MPKRFTHFAFADEHNHDSGSGQYGSIALITMKREAYKGVSEQIEKSIIDAGVKKTEFKWTNTKRTNHQKAAKNIIECAVKLSLQRYIRIDVILWDYEDARHDIENRDNIKNFHIMYYNLLKYVLGKCWQAGSNWLLYPDQTSCVKWDRIQDVTNAKKMIATDPTFFDLSKILQSYHIVQIKQVSSASSPVNQAADLFAGLVAYSRNSYHVYQDIKEQEYGKSLFQDGGNEENKDIDKKRCEIIDQLLKHKKKQKLGISFKNTKGLRSMNPKPEYPINFWWYNPQHKNDKAPVKSDNRGKSNA